VLRRRPVTPEESPGPRLAVFGGVVVAAASIGVFGGLLVLAVLCVLVIAAGHYWSWRSRQRPRRFVRVLVGLALLGATFLLLAELFLGVGADPFPQGSFLLLLMAITSFDVRSRANCYSSLVFGLLGLYAAASVAYDATMALCAVAFAVAVLAAFAMATRADAQRATVVPASAQQPPPAEGLATPASSSFQPSWALAALCGVVLSCAVATYAIVPAYVGALPIYPVSADLSVSQSFTGEVLNPVLPLISLRGPNHLRAGYYGFAPELRLGAYGPLDATVVMRVRSTGWSYWRMQTFDRYTGRSWRTANGLLNQLERGPDGAMEPAVYPLDDGEYHAPGSAAGAPTATIRQTFTLAQPGPNLIAAAYRPIRLYFPSTAVAQRINADDLIADQPLPAGATYSVVSQAPDTTPALLRAATGPDPWFASSDDLVLPALPARLTAVARAATAGAATRYDRVMAMIAYLDSHARYDLTTPALPPGAEGVSALLSSGRGYCEAFATALTVLARLNGIPARLVTGFAPGEYNSLSHVYTVRASDAHAWTEIYFPGRGWLPFDATPGGAAQPRPHVTNAWLLGALLADHPLPRLDWAGLAHDSGAAASQSSLWLRDAAQWAALRPTSSPLAFLPLLAALLLLVAWRARWPAPRQAGGSYRQAILASFAAAERALARHGCPRRAAAATPRRYAREVAALLPAPGAVALAQLAELATRAAYAGPEPTAADARAARRLRQELRRVRRGR